MEPNILLKMERDKRGWTQKEVADQIKAGEASYHRWESQGGTPLPYYRQELARLFGKTIEELGLLPGQRSRSSPIDNLAQKSEMQSGAEAADKLGFTPHDVSFEHNGEEVETAHEEEKQNSGSETPTTPADTEKTEKDTSEKVSPSVTVHFSDIPVLAQQSEAPGGITPAVIMPIPYLLERGMNNGVSSSFLNSSVKYIVEGDRERETTPTIVSTGYMGKKSIDIAVYRKNVRVALYLHRTSTAQGFLPNLNADLQDLAECENHVKRNDLYQVREVVISNDLLAAKIVKDQRNYAHAHQYADHAVQIAHSLEDGELLATTKYMRGCINLEWGLFGTLEEMKLQPDEQRIKDAIDDFLTVLQSAHSRYVSIHPQLQGFTMLQLARAGCFLPEDQYKMNPLMLVEQAAKRVNCDPLDDAYTRLLVTGTLSGLHWGHIISTKLKFFLRWECFHKPSMK